jgi:predicted polyphosphate/ATP-dependent NAD kinase
VAGPVVGIIANPVSARDIRRVVSHAGSLQIADRANIVLCVLVGLAASGVTEVVMMPENAGIRGHLTRAMARAAHAGETTFPQLRFLDMKVAGQASDSATAARRMSEMNVSAIVVLGGDGTHRVVVSQCGDVPIAGVSTGTNNAFAETREPTVTGLAVGLAVTGAVPRAAAFADNKKLEVSINDRREIALVDVAIVRERFVGSRALWKADSFSELFVTFSESVGIGMSSIVGLLAPVKRDSPFGRRVIFERAETAPFRLAAPIAPGLVQTVGIERVDVMPLDTPMPVTAPVGSIAFDGEREVTFCERDEVQVVLRAAGFRTVDISACMEHAATKGLLVEASAKKTLVSDYKGGCS